MHGAGTPAVNSLSQEVEARVERQGKVQSQEHRRGEPVAPLATGSGTVP